MDRLSYGMLDTIQWFFFGLAAVGTITLLVGAYTIDNKKNTFITECDGCLVIKHLYEKTV